MPTWEEVKKAELGQSFDIGELNHCCKAIYGGVSWPGKRPGCAVIVAMNHAQPSGSHEVCLLAEFESESVREVVRQCGILDFKYAPETWIGDGDYGAAARFIDEINENRREREQSIFSLSEPFELLEMKPLYPFILDEMKRLLAQDRRRLFLPGDSKIPNYLSGIAGGEIAELELGAYPAVEALAFAVIEIMRDGRYRPPPRRDRRPLSPMD
jgi:hypothetical protein